MKKYDVVIIGCGVYGLYISTLNLFKNKNVLIIECDDKAFSRASYINQARLHNGYHYPRSLDTAKDTHKYFSKFNEEFAYAINSRFKNIYAIAQNGSLTNASKFEEFCKQADIPYEEVTKEDYFKEGMVEKAYLTEEYVFDSNKIKANLLEKAQTNNVEIRYNTFIKEQVKKSNHYVLKLNNDEEIESHVVINTTYVGVNLINKLFDAKLLNLKYELCEVELGKVSNDLKDYSFTIMDGDYFSTMPFGNENVHTLTSVHFTPHVTSYEQIPIFECQKKHKLCGKGLICNCNECPYKPKSKNKEMLDLFNSYLLDKYKFEYKDSLFTIKPILMSSEDDDSRPTIIEKHSNNPTFISCLSGKVSTIYLMEEFIKEALKEEKYES